MKEIKFKIPSPPEDWRERARGREYRLRLGEYVKMYGVTLAEAAAMLEMEEH